MARYLDDETTVVVLSNVQSVARDEIRWRVAATLFGVEAPDRARRSFLSEAPVALDELVRVYEFGPGFDVSVRVEDGRLLARANQGGSSELVPTASGPWFSRMLYATVPFERNAEGVVDRLFWGAGERAPVGRRVR